MPNFLDIYYHLSVAQGFAKAGGFSAHDFWSYAPFGRPHLYPPLFHFLILAFLKSGLSALFIARLLDLLVFPLFLIVIWFFMRELFSRQLAFFAVLISSSLYSFYLASSNFMPVTIAFMFGLLSLLAHQKNRSICAAIFLALCFYTHAQIPWFFILTYIFYGLSDRTNLARCFKTAGLGILLSLPMIIYLLRNIPAYHPKLAYENFVLELNLYLLLTILGLKKVFQEKSKYYLLLSLGISAFPFIFSYPYRYISGQGLVGWIFLSSLGLERIYVAAQVRRSFLILLVVLLLLFSPTLIFAPLERVFVTGRGFLTGSARDKNFKLAIFNSTYINLVSLEKTSQRPNDYSISSSKFIDELIKIVRKNSQDGDIIFTNLDFVGTMIASLSDRADAKGMVREVLPEVKSDPIPNARIIIWFKDYEARPDKNLTAVVAKYNLEKIGETDIAYIYRNNLVQSKEQLNRANIPSNTVFLICLLALSALVWDLAQKQK